MRCRGGHKRYVEVQRRVEQQQQQQRAFPVSSRGDLSGVIRGIKAGYTRGRRLRKKGKRGEIHKEGGWGGGRGRGKQAQREGLWI